MIFPVIVTIVMAADFTEIPSLVVGGKHGYPVELYAALVAFLV